MDIFQLVEHIRSNFFVNVISCEQLTIHLYVHYVVRKCLKLDEKAEAMVLLGFVDVELMVENTKGRFRSEKVSLLNPSIA